LKPAKYLADIFTNNCKFSCLNHIIGFLDFANDAKEAQNTFKTRKPARSYSCLLHTSKAINKPQKCKNDNNRKECF